MSEHDHEKREITSWKYVASAFTLLLTFHMRVRRLTFACELRADAQQVVLLSIHSSRSTSRNHVAASFATFC